MSESSTTTQTQVFSQKLSEYKQHIDQDIEQYIRTVERQTLNDYGPSARLGLDVYLRILRRGGKRIRGSLALAAYEMAGGKRQALGLQLARVLEMLHAYVLIIDDIQDRSRVRRGGPSAHADLAAYHQSNELAGDSEHFGISVAMNAALVGNHLAQQVLLDMDIDADTKVTISSLINNTMVTTAHGQTNDIVNEVVAEVSAQDIEHVLEWKTAHYTFVSPLQSGMALAGEQVDDSTIKDYAVHAGKAFQITDDILGTFGTEFESGKSPMDDIREGKRTLIIAHALEHTSASNKNFLIRMLGNSSISPVEFERCKAILTESGALAAAQVAARDHISAALSALRASKSQWSREGVDFLSGLTQQLLGRTS